MTSEPNAGDNEKLRVYVFVLERMLETDDTRLATKYFGKAAHLNLDTCEPLLVFRLKSIQAQFFDRHQKFMEASKTYYELSTLASLSEIQRREYLNAAIICIALSPACPARSKILATFFEDRNAIYLSSYFILEKLHFNKILFPHEIERFSRILKPYQNLRLEDGTTILMRAVIEHNLLSASKIYYNIHFSQLGNLLGISADMAHHYAAKMIQQRHLSGKIDQVSELISFDNTNPIYKTETKQWDNSIQKIFADIETISSQICLKYNNDMT